MYSYMQCTVCTQNGITVFWETLVTIILNKLLGYTQIFSQTSSITNKAHVYNYITCTCYSNYYYDHAHTCKYMHLINAYKHI